jgi:hypothetical protein
VYGTRGPNSSGYPRLLRDGDALREGSGCTTYRGRLSHAQILEAADSIGVARFLCRILDMAFREFIFF